MLEINKRIYRVISSNGNILKVQNDDGEVLLVRVSSSLLNESADKSPVVGDFVELNDDNKVISVNRRKNKISRKRPGKKLEEQIIAANIDIMFITTSLNRDFNINRIGRYILLAKSNSIKPIIIFTKVDICDDADRFRIEVLKEYKDIEIILTSSFKNYGIDRIRDILSNDVVTAIFLGSSGVGKSSIVNKILNDEVMKVNEISKNEKGKHTTTSRELFILENGSCIIDTPGMRELGFWLESHYNEDFSDISDFAKECRFSDCSHTVEPDCMVLEKLREGIISKKSYDRFIKMSREIKSTIKLKNKSK